MSRKIVSFSALEKAFWRYVEEQCPHPVQSRHRYTWVRTNLRFTHAGILFERRSSTERGVSGRPVHVIRFTGADGTVIEDQQEVASLAGV